MPILAVNLSSVVLAFFVLRIVVDALFAPDEVEVTINAVFASIIFVNCPTVCIFLKVA